MRLKHINVCFFALLLIVLSILDVVGGQVVFSTLENRYLATRPKFQLEDVLKGDYTLEYENYIDDQFFKRQTWMSGKSIFERLMGKTENNNVVIGTEGYLFHKFISLPSQFDKNIETIKSFATKNADIPMTFLMAPNSYAVLKLNVPFGLYNIPQEETIEEVYKKLSTSKIVGIDTLSAFKATTVNNLFFKLDHHWTTQGAYVAYQAWCASKGYLPADLSQWNKEYVDDFKGTLYSALKDFNAKSDVIEYYDMPHANVIIDDVIYQGLYDLSYAERKDKYGLFLYNNPGRLTIQSSFKGAKGSLIIFKDSYANSFIPFLTTHYEKIEVIDLRYFNGNVSNLMKHGEYDEVLFLYYLVTFSEEDSLDKLK